MKCFRCNREMDIVAVKEVDDVIIEKETCRRCWSRAETEYNKTEKSLVSVKWTIKHGKAYEG